LGVQGTVEFPAQDTGADLDFQEQPPSGDRDRCGVEQGAVRQKISWKGGFTGVPV
jgi:hypothetical protein